MKPLPPVTRTLLILHISVARTWLPANLVAPMQTYAVAIRQWCVHRE